MSRYIEHYEKGSRNWISSRGRSGREFVEAFHETVAAGMLPNQLRGSFLITLWAVYESALLEVAASVRENVRPRARKFDKRKGGLLRASTKYFPEMLGFARAASRDEERWLTFLYRLRNAFAHANGRRGAMPPEQWNKLAQDMREFGGFGMSRNYLELEPQLIVELLDMVTEALAQLIVRARSALAKSVAPSRATTT